MVYCSNCKNLHSDEWNTYCFIGEWKASPYAPVRVVHEPGIKNRNNDCKNYSPSVWRRIKIMLNFVDQQLGNGA